MNHLKDLEDKVHAHAVKPRRPFYLTAGIFAFGLALLATGLFLRNGTISADIASDTPPVPPAPTTSALPVTPADPGSNMNAGDLGFPAGWSMIAGSVIEGYDLLPLKNAGVYLYSFNDPAYPVTQWATYPTGEIVPAEPLGYYVFNPTGASQKVALKDKSVPSAETIYGRGWHLVFWPGDSLGYSDLANSVTLKYADATRMALAEAMSSDNHRASVKIYVVTNEYSPETGSVKELAASDSATTISKIPKKSYFWIYLRRTKDRVVGIEVGS